MPSSTKQFQRARRAPRKDGQTTRNDLLEAAGRIFAERGFADATSKDICTLAGANSAAVNYYFGSKEGLYEEVLVAGHKQMLSLENLTNIVESAASPENKLRAVLELFLKTALDSANLWGIRVFLRELASPTIIVDKVMLDAVFPKAAKLQELIREITGLPPHSPRIQRATAFVVLPCISLFMFPENMRVKVLPATTARSAGLLDDLTSYVLGGLKALRD